MRFRWLMVFPLLFLFAQAAVRYEMSKAEVIQELGKPTSALLRPGSGREILIYPKGVRIELEKDKVISVKGIDLAAAEQAAASAAEEKPDPDKGVAAKLTPEEAKAVATAEAEADYKVSAVKGQAQAEMEKAITEMENHSTQTGLEKIMPPFQLKKFIFEIIIKWLLMIAALKLTCKYWGADVDWGGLMLAAGADTGVRAVVAIVGKVILKAFTLFYLDEALGAVVLIFVLRKVSTNQSLQQAVTITMTSKVFSTVVGSFLVTVLLNVFH
jgi:hypothetical protein